MDKISDAKVKANKKWNNKNKERLAYLNKRSTAKNFILKLANADDLINCANTSSRGRSN